MGRRRREAIKLKQMFGSAKAAPTETTMYDDTGLDPYELGCGECTKETHKDGKKAGALLVKFEDGKELWIPKSVVHDDSEVWKEGQDGDVVVFAWWGEQNA